MRRFGYFCLSLMFVPLVLLLLLFSSPSVAVAGKKVQKTLNLVLFLIKYKSDMPRQRRPSAMMDFFEGHVFYGGENAVPIEAALVAANVPDSSGNIADLAYRHNSFEPYVLSNGDENRSSSEGATIYGNTSDGSLIDVAPARTSRKRKFEKGEGSSIDRRDTTEKEINGDGITELDENFTAGNQTSCGQSLTRKKEELLLLRTTDPSLFLSKSK